MLAVGNALPGPIATKIAAFVGYEAGGWIGLRFQSVGIWQSVGISLVAFLALTKGRIHPALVIMAAFVYRGLVLPQKEKHPLENRGDA